MILKHNATENIIEFAQEESHILPKSTVKAENTIEKEKELFELAKNGSPEDLKSFIEETEEIYINKIDSEGWTPIMKAAKYNENPEVIKTILSYGANIYGRYDPYEDIHSNIDYEIDKTPLEIAIEFNNNQEVIEIISYYKDLTEEYFEHAKHSNDPDKIISIIQEIYNVNAKNSIGNWPLLEAVKHNENFDVIKTLINYGGDYKSLGPRGNTTVLMEAARHNNNPKIISLITEKDAEVNHINRWGATPLLLAAEYNQNIEVIKELVKAGAHIRQQSLMIESPLEIAEEKNSNPEVEKILRKTLKKRDKFFDLIEDGEVKDLENLINKGINVNIKDIEGYTGLMNVVKSHEKIKILELLLNAGADVNARNKDGQTALMLASEYNATPKVTEVLLDNGAKVNAKDEYGGSAFTYALEYNANSKVQQLLEQALVEEHSSISSLFRGFYVNAIKDRPIERYLTETYASENLNILNLLKANMSLSERNEAASQIIKADFNEIKIGENLYLSFMKNDNYDDEIHAGIITKEDNDWKLGLLLMDLSPHNIIHRHFNDNKINKQTDGVSLSEQKEIPDEPSELFRSFNFDWINNDEIKFYITKANANKNLNQYKSEVQNISKHQRNDYLFEVETSKFGDFKIAEDLYIAYWEREGRSGDVSLGIITKENNNLAIALILGDLTYDKISHVEILRK